MWAEIRAQGRKWIHNKRTITTQCCVIKTLWVKLEFYHLSLQPSRLLLKPSAELHPGLYYKHRKIKVQSKEVPPLEIFFHWCSDVQLFSLLGNFSPALRQISSDRLLLLLSHLFRENLLPGMKWNYSNKAEERRGGSIQQVFSSLPIPLAQFSFPFHYPQCGGGEEKEVVDIGDSGDKGRIPEEVLRLGALRIMQETEATVNCWSSRLILCR